METSDPSWETGVLTEDMVCSLMWDVLDEKKTKRFHYDEHGEREIGPADVEQLIGVLRLGKNHVLTLAQFEGEDFFRISRIKLAEINGEPIDS